MLDALVFTSIGIVIGLSIQLIYRECWAVVSQYRIVKR